MPKYAKKHFIISLAEMLSRLEEMIVHMASNDITINQVHEEFLDTEVIFIKHLNQLQRMAEEVHYESPLKPQRKLNYKQIIIHLRRIYRLFAVTLYHLPPNIVRQNGEVIKKLVIIADKMHLCQQLLSSSKKSKHLLLQRVHETQKTKLETNGSGMLMESLLDNLIIEVDALIKLI